MKKIYQALKLFGYALLMTIILVSSSWLLMHYFKVIEALVGSLENTILVIEIILILIICCIISYIIFEE